MSEPQVDTASTQKIRYYPMIKTTLDKFRKDEIKLSNDKLRHKKSFYELFETRLDEIPGKRETFSINIYTKIETNSRKGSHGHFTVGTQKTYGPFTVKKPVQLSIPDTYKFAMYTLLKEKFQTLSGEYISAIGCRLIKLDKKQFKHHKMGKLRLKSYLLNKQRPIKSHSVNSCVIDYVWDQVRGSRGFKTYSYEKLKNEIYMYVPEGDMISTEELTNWAKTHDNISIHAFDCRHRKFITHIAVNTRTNIALVYVVKDRHMYPITNEKLKIVASKANQGGCDDLLKHMSDLKWTRRHENVTKIESIEEISSLDKENHIVVLPEKIRMKEAVDLYSRNENFYVE